MSSAVAALRSGIRFNPFNLAGNGGGKRKRGAKPVEHSLMLTAAMCLVAFGVVMVFSASSTASLLGESGDGAYFLKRTLMFGVIGIIAYRVLSTAPLGTIRRFTPALLAVSCGLLVLVMVPGFSKEVNGAQSWLALGPIQVQPSEIAKISLILYGAHMIALRPGLTTDLRSMRPYLLVCATVCGLILLEPDLGTAMVSAFSVSTLLIAAGAKLRHLAVLAAVLLAVGLVMIAMAPYRAERITSFLSPDADPGGAGYQISQATYALGSGGIFGTGLGESVQKAFYLPEAHTDMIAAVIGEEVGLVGIGALVALYMLFCYAGFRTAQKAKDRYGRLLAAGLTAMIMIQATINLYAVMGMAPLTGVPLPFVSYGNSSLIITLAAVGLMLNVAGGGTASAGFKEQKTSSSRSRSGRSSASRKPRKRLVAIDGGGRAPRPSGRPATRRAAATRKATGRGASNARSDRSRRDGRARSTGTGRRRRA